MTGTAQRRHAAIAPAPRLVNSSAVGVRRLLRRLGVREITENACPERHTDGARRAVTEHTAEADARLILLCGAAHVAVVKRQEPMRIGGGTGSVQLLLGLAGSSATNRPGGFADGATVHRLSAGLPVLDRAAASRADLCLGLALTTLVLAAALFAPLVPLLTSSPPVLCVRIICQIKAERAAEDRQGGDRAKQRAPRARSREHPRQGIEVGSVHGRTPS